MNYFEEKFASLDLIDEVIYVCDIETYDLVYCNRFARENIPAYQVGEKPVKCYECLQGLDHPCVFCNNDELKEKKHCVWSRLHPLNGRQYLLHDSILELDGKEYRMELAVDLSYISEMAEHIKDLMKVENYLTNCVRRLVRSDDFHEAVNTVLQTVMNFYGGERAYVFDFDWEKKISNNIYEMCAPGVSAEIDNLQNVPLEVMHVWVKAFQMRSIMVIEDVDTLKFDETRRDEYETLNAQNIHSIIAVPIYIDDKIMGFLGVDNPVQNFENTEFLVDLAYFIGTEVRKNQYVHDLQEMNLKDSMNGVSNRNAYTLFLKKSEHENRENVGVAFLDMNGLKYLNDNFGHEYGDRQIRKFCDVLLKYYAKEQIFRISGDEFVVIEQDISYADFQDKMKELKTELYVDQKGIASIGYIWDDSNTPLQILQNQAEQLMYAEKQKYYLFDVDNMRNVRPKYISDVIEALKKDTYLVYLQPKYSLETNRVYGAEALIRKLNENGQIVYPIEFVSAMEREHAISFVDYYVFEKVCKTLKEWEQRGLPKMVISTNFSRSTIAENDFTERVLEICEQTGVDAGQLILEVTESSNVVRVQELTDIMRTLKKHGLKFALDDMGTEYATLEMLEVVELDMAKFDKSLIKRVQHGQRSQLILEKLVDLCHSLGMICVAEGVETQEQLEAVRESGCDRVQGYLIGKPMPIEEFEEKYL